MESRGPNDESSPQIPDAGRDRPTGPGQGSPGEAEGAILTDEQLVRQQQQQQQQ